MLNSLGEKLRNLVKTDSPLDASLHLEVDLPGEIDYLCLSQQTGFPGEIGYLCPSQEAAKSGIFFSPNAKQMP